MKRTLYIIYFFVYLGSPTCAFGDFNLLKNYIKQIESNLLQLANLIGRLEKTASKSTPRVNVDYSKIWEARANWLQSNPSIGQKLSLHPDNIKKYFIDDVAKFTPRNKEIPQKPSDKSIVRVASYNVHFWRDINNGWKREDIFENILSIDADILLLQEATVNSDKSIDYATVFKSFCDRMKGLGYQYCAFQGADNDRFGNAILIKPGFKITRPNQKKYNAQDKNPRSYLEATLELPNKKTLSVYATHFEVHSSDVAAAQAQELIKIMNANPSTYKLVGADFNAVRQKDYNYRVNGFHVWNDLFNERLATYNPSTKPVDAFEQADYINAFDVAKKMNGNHGFTVWTGTIVDFIYLNKGWNLPVDLYVYYSAASDHLPVIVDIHMAQ